MNPKSFMRLLGLLLVALQWTYGQNSAVKWWTSSSGYADSKSGNSMMVSVVGDQFVGTMTTGNSLVSTGFLAEPETTPTSVLSSDNLTQPAAFWLSQNYPNPFNPSTTIDFTLPENGHATLNVYNMLGQEVATLLDRDLESGSLHHAVFNADKLATGMYIARLQFLSSASRSNGERHLIMKMMMLK